MIVNREQDNAVPEDYTLLSEDNKIKARRYIGTLLSLERAEAEVAEKRHMLEKAKNAVEEEYNSYNEQALNDPKGEALKDRCSFCGREKNDTTLLILADNANICSDCIRRIYHVLDKNA